MAEEKKVVLVSSDGVSFELKESIALQSETIKVMMTGPRADQPMPIPNVVTGEILAKVVEYMEKHAAEEVAALPGAIYEWDFQFVDVDHKILFDYILAANFSEIKGLLDLSCQKVTDMIKGKSPAEIRAIFNVKDEFTPEEEEEIRRENQWAFE